MCAPSVGTLPVVIMAEVRADFDSRSTVRTASGQCCLAQFSTAVASSTTSFAFFIL